VRIKNGTRNLSRGNPECPHNIPFQRPILTLASRLKSFDLTAVALEVAADIRISCRHVQRHTREVGADLARQRDDQADRYRHRTENHKTEKTKPVLASLALNL
jgi:hypothetical protein